MARSSALLAAAALAAAALLGLAVMTVEDRQGPEQTLPCAAALCAIVIF
jgi:hypothetical protein